MALRPLLLAGCAALAIGCSSSPDHAGTKSDDVTSVRESPVKNQSIGNCWIYATLGWVESMHLSRTGETLNLSESYLTYLATFVRLTNDEFVFDPDGEYNTGDFYGQAAELIARYGLMDEAAFVAGEATVDRSARQESAMRLVVAAVKEGGALDTVDKRRDPVAVRAVLDEAFSLPPEIVRTMSDTFGADLSRTRAKGARLPTEGFHDPATMIVATLVDGHEVTLDEALGELDPDREVSDVRDRKERRGPYAWQRVDFADPTGRDEAILRLKKTLNAGFPVPIDWYPAWDSMRRDDGSFHAPVRGEGGWHASLAHDYQITLESGRVLAAGTPVEDPDLLDATLRPGATIEFLRMKNSWGRETGPLSARGYTDAWWDYLTWEFERPRIDYDQTPTRGAAIAELTLPPASWDGARH